MTRVIGRRLRFSGHSTGKSTPEQSVSQPTERRIQIFDRLPQAIDLPGIDQRLALSRQPALDHGIQ